MQQLYAEIRQSSKYAYQAELCRQQGYGHPFKVRIEPAPDGYSVKGGYGGRYRIEDVDLFVIEGEAKVRLN